MKGRFVNSVRSVWSVESGLSPAGLVHEAKLQSKPI